MRKTISTLLMVLLLLGVASASVSGNALEEATRSLKMGGVEDSGDEDVIEKDVKSMALSSLTPEECFAKAKEKYPDAVEARLRAWCRKAIAIDKIKEQGKKVREELKELRKTIKETRKDRELSDDDKEEHEQKFEEAKERFRLAKENYKSARERFEDAKEKLKSCKDEDSDECTDMRQQAFDNAQKLLTDAADRLIAHLEKIREKIETAEYLNETQVTDAVGEIDQAIEEIKALKEGILEATTKDELKEYAKQLNSIIKRVKLTADLHSARYIHNRMAGWLEQMRVLDGKLEKIQTYVENNNLTVEGLDEKIKEYNENVADAKEAYDLGQEKFNAAIEARKDGSAEEAKTLLEEAKDSLKTAQEKLKAAHEKLKEIMKLVREAKVDVDRATDDDEEDDDESNAESDEE